MRLILKDIQEKLTGIDPNTYYGTAAQHPKNEPWDYIVFSRDILKRNDGKSGYTDILNVSIVREEFIPEGIEEEVIEAMEAIAGVRLQQGNHEYYYSVKPGTQLTVEMILLKFTHARKR